MRRNLFLICGGLFTLIGVLLLAASFLAIGINDGEWGRISKKGVFSGASELVWSPWQANPNEDSIEPFEGFRTKRVQVLPEVRSGYAKGLLFDFKVYEGRTIPGDATSTVPAIGPGWGAHYHGEWAVGSLAVASIFFVLAFQTRKPCRKISGF